MKTTSPIRKALSVVVVAVALISAPAFAAADSGNHDWTGAHVGANVGAGMSTGNIDDPDGFFGFSSAFSERLLQAGADVGYDKQFGSTVLGAEAELNWGSQNHRETLSQNNNPQITVVSRVDWTAALLAKVGVAVGDSLFFVDAGPALARSSGNADRSNGFETAYANWQPSFKAGVGVEFMVSRNLSLRAQYSTLTIADRYAYVFPNPSGTTRVLWTNAQSVATIGAAWHF